MLRLPVVFKEFGKLFQIVPPARGNPDQYWDTSSIWPNVVIQNYDIRNYEIFVCKYMCRILLRTGMYS